MKSSIIKLLKERYFLPTETIWEDIAKRVSVIYPEIEENIRNLEFIPSSPTLMNCNTKGYKSGTLSSCFTMKIEDSIEGIFEAVKESAIVTKNGGGIGYDFSNLRGSSEIVQGIGRPSSGPLPFINVFNSTLDGIMQGGVRRGAGMGMLDIDHKNILDFIEAKSIPGAFTRLNFSVRVTDKFYDQLEKSPNSTWLVKNVVDGKEEPLIDKTGKEVSVKQLWDIIIDRAWSTAEPGIFNSDIAFRQCSVTNVDKNVLSNPCVTGDTLILTDKGSIRIDSVIGQKINVWNGQEFSEVEPKITGVNQIIIDFEFNDGTILSTTPYHMFIESLASCDVETRAEDLHIGSCCKKFTTISTLYTEVFVVKKIIRLEPGSFVYCFNEPKLHQGVFNGILTKQCSEYVSIPYGSCNLGSINLSKLVESRKFNWDKFEELISKSVRYLDGVIDANKFPIKKIKETTLKIRPVGLGYMGLAHALYKKRIPYNSEKGFKFVEEVTRYLTLRSMKESVELAKVHGAYEAFDYDTYMNANKRFFDKGDCRNIDIEQLKKDIKKYGVRNSVTTSIAPTGSIAYIADASSGIEPVFALTYMRKIEKENKTHEVVYISDPVFDEYLNSTHANFTEDDKVQILKCVADNQGSCQKCDLLPEEIRKVFVVAGDISPIDHLEALSRASVNVATSISKTINLPKDISKEEVAKVYIEAYKKGIVGVTVYRDSCREGILVHKIDSRPTDIQYHHAPKRPKELECDVHRVTYKGEKWISFVSLFNEKPFEVFCGKIDEVSIPKQIEKGKIVKLASGHYSFVHDDEILIKDITKTFNNEDNDDFARSISLSLRSGVMIEHICDTLNKAKGDITKFSKVLVRILKQYVKDGTTASGKCEKCGSKLLYKDGCISCENPECGWSKCG
jgi:ribonucleoside-diphosphate reductase alpha chain